MRITKLIAVALSLVLPTSGCDLSSTPTEPETRIGADARAVMVPFKAHYVAQIVDVQSCSGGAPRFLAEGEGTGTYLGHFTIDLSFCGRGATLDGGEGTFVAADGDLLRITFHGVSDEAFPVQHFTSFVTFDGGTGRFENATGTATVQGSFDVTTGSGPADWEGMISLPQPH